ncbi:MAG: ImmA/IrrE family metallo-endopeptidase [Polyangiaceae bacterium]|nr:ImmA/IrrE family metallo-endopeptidase [Polyangiaceae bacterium]
MAKEKVAKQKAAMRRSVAKPRSLLAAALRKLEHALDADPRDLGRRVREFTARFHAYTPLNRALVFLQRPDATFLNGRKKWATLGRDVKAKAKAIRLLAPNLGPGEAGATRSFKEVKVYDIGDTEGESVKVPALAIVSGRPEAIEELLKKLERWVEGSGLSLRYESPRVNDVVDGATNGLQIWIRPDLPPSARLSVLAHEIAHVKLHFTRRRRGQLTLIDRPVQAGSRDERELQAELTKFLMLEVAGIDSSQGAAAYLNTWRASKASISANAERCLTVACAVLRDCEQGRYRSLVKANVATVSTEALAAVT